MRNRSKCHSGEHVDSNKNRNSNLSARACRARQSGKTFFISFMFKNMNVAQFKIDLIGWLIDLAKRKTAYDTSTVSVSDSQLAKRIGVSRMAMHLWRQDIYPTEANFMRLMDLTDMDEDTKNAILVHVRKTGGFGRRGRRKRT